MTASRPLPRPHPDPAGFNRTSNPYHYWDEKDSSPSLLHPFAQSSRKSSGPCVPRPGADAGLFRAPPRRAGAAAAVFSICFAERAERGAAERSPRPAPVLRRRSSLTVWSEEDAVMESLGRLCPLVCLQTKKCRKRNDPTPTTAVRFCAAQPAFLGRRRARRAGPL